MNEFQLNLVPRGEDALPEEGNNEPPEWEGMPRFVVKPKPPSLVLSFDSEEERDELIAQLGVTLAKKTKQTWSAWYPPREREDLSALRFDFGDDAA